jgi:heptaprenyl diphosphate synthase
MLTSLNDNSPQPPEQPQLESAVTHDARRLTTSEIASAAAAERLVTELAQPASYLLATPGKQLRSTVVLCSAHAGPNPDDPAVRIGAVAIELFQTVTLAHDDVVDDGKVRRGTDTAGAIYGHFASAFAGGALFARASELIASCGSEPTERFARATSEVCEGQMSEFEDLFNLRRSVQRYHAAIAGKTASLFKLAAWLGAWLAGAPPEITEVLARFGREFGMAFQVADDILDLIAPETETGKPRAKDLRQGVYTSPVIYALQADESLCAALEHAFTDEERLAIVERIERCGGIDHARRECLSWAERARMALNTQLGPTEVSRTQLTSLLDEALAPIACRTTPEAAIIA